ncbi:hypothetical protein EDD15DRAFT_1553117 [Pisolithus albus]|nr:hypothetical protein EDD15DRAFT_1553117 [Pisolithus albus]
MCRCCYSEFLRWSGTLRHSLLVLWVSGLRCCRRRAGIDSDAELFEKGLRDVRMEFRGPLSKILRFSGHHCPNGQKSGTVCELNPDVSIYLVEYANLRPP